MFAKIISCVALIGAVTVGVQATSVRQAAPTDVKQFCGAITDKAGCNVHEFCSYKDDKQKCDNLNSVVEAINNAACYAYDNEAECNADPLCKQGKKTMRCKGDNAFILLNADKSASETGVTQPTEGKYVHTSKYCRTFITEEECKAGPHFDTVCEWEEATPAIDDKEAKAAHCDNKVKTNTKANAAFCTSSMTADACAADMRCELGLVGSEESCKPSDQIIVLV